MKTNFLNEYGFSVVNPFSPSTENTNENINGEAFIAEIQPINLEQRAECDFEYGTRFKLTDDEIKYAIVSYCLPIITKVFDGENIYDCNGYAIKEYNVDSLQLNTPSKIINYVINYNVPAVYVSHSEQEHFYIDLENKYLTLQFSSPIDATPLASS